MRCGPPPARKQAPRKAVRRPSHRGRPLEPPAGSRPGARRPGCALRTSCLPAVPKRRSEPAGAGGCAGRHSARLTLGAALSSRSSAFPLTCQTCRLPSAVTAAMYSPSGSYARLRVYGPALNVLSTCAGHLVHHAHLPAWCRQPLAGALAFVSAAVMSFTPASSPAATSLVPSGLYATARTGRVNLVATPHSSRPGSLYSCVLLRVCDQAHQAHPCAQIRAAARAAPSHSGSHPQQQLACRLGSQQGSVVEQTV